MSRVSVYASYKGVRVEGTFDTASNRLGVTTDPLAGEEFRSPTAAAVALIRTLNPDRSRPQTNGWDFWRVKKTDETLASLRQS